MNDTQRKVWVNAFLETSIKMLGEDPVLDVFKSMGAGVDPQEVIKLISKKLDRDQATEMGAVLQNALTRALGKGELVQVVQSGDGMCVTPMQELIDKAAKGEMVYFVSMTIRTGLGMAMSEIEHKMFPPEDDSNDLFEYYSGLIGQGEMSLPMIVFGVPMSYRDQVESILLSHGLKASGENTEAVIIGFGGDESFGVHGKNIFNLSNVSTSQVYKNNKAAVEEDVKRCDAEMAFLRAQAILKEKEKKDGEKEGTKETTQEA